MSNDFSLAPTTFVPNPNLNANKQTNKPRYLIVLEKHKTTEPEFFLCIEQPQILDNIALAKGIFCTHTEKKIQTTFHELLTNMDPSLIIECMFPLPRIVRIQNLSFSAANKNKSPAST